MKKKVVLPLIAVLVVLIPFSVFGATSSSTIAKGIRGFLGIDSSKLTDTQKSDIKSYNQKMADLQKDFLNQMVKNGSITQAQADAEIKKIEDALKNNDGTYVTPGFGRGFGGERGMRKGFAGIDVSKLTQAQKDTLKSNLIDIANLKKTALNSLVDKELFTAAQAKTETDEVDAYIADLNKNGISTKTDVMGPMNLDVMRYVGNVQLTTEQQAVITDFNTKATAVQKTIVKNLVSFGVLTQAQADSFNQMLDNKGTMMNGFAGGRGMKGFDRGGMRGGMRRGMRGGFDGNAGTTKGTAPSTTTAAPTAKSV
jgi:hypothetical protein